MIKEINLVNCQSIGNVTYNLSSDKLNVIVADNNVGKSVLFKMLKLFASSKYYTASERKELIRWGADYALISLTIDTGEIYSVAVFPTYVMNIYQKDINSDLENREYFTFEELKHIGLLTNDSFMANVLDSDQDMALVTSNQRTNYDLMQLLLHDDVIENLQSKVAEQLSQSGLIEQELVKKRVEVNSLLSANTYQNLDELKEKQKYVQIATSLVEKLVMVNSTLDGFVFSDGFEFNDHAYTLLSKLQLPAIEVLDSIDLEKHVSLLSKLTLPGIEVIKSASVDTHLKLLEHLTLPEVSDEIGIASEVNTILKELESCSDVIECPIHGKVVSMYDKCLYIDN